MWTTCNQNFSSIGPCLLELLPQPPPPPLPKKGPNWVLNQLFLWIKVENGKYPEAATWRSESVDGWSSYRLCENF